MKKSRKIIGAVATVTVFGVFTRFISFIFKIYLSRVLGAEALGLYQIALSVFFLFSAFSSSGIPLVLSRKTAEHNALNKNDTFSLFTTSLIISTGLSVTIAIVLSLINSHLSFLFSDKGALPLFLIMIPALVSTSIYCVVRGWFWGDKQFTAFSATETIEECLRILFGVLFISGVLGSISGEYAIALAFTASDILVAVILLAIFFIKGGKITKPTQIKEILLPSLPITAMRILSSLIGTLTAFILPLRLVTSGMSGAEATATFGRISGMANPLLFAPNAIISSLSIVLIPEMSASMAKNDLTNLNKQLTLGINFSFLISGLFMVIYSSIGSAITNFLYDDVISGQYLQVATFCMIPVVLSQMTQSALNSIGKEYTSFINYLCGNIVMLFIIYALPKYIGIYTVAVASFVSTTIISIMNVLSLKKETTLSTDFIKYAFLVVLFVLPCAFITKCVYSLCATMPIVFAIIIAVTVGCCSYFALCLITNVLDIRGIILQRFHGKFSISPKRKQTVDKS